MGFADCAGNGIVSKCCNYTNSERKKLPRCNKAVLYLDQFAYSNMAKALDDVWARERPAQDPIWHRLFDAVDRALKLQLIVCPSSTIHECESIVHQHFGVLERLYEHFASGTAFIDPKWIHRIQLLRAFDAYLASTEPCFSAIRRESVIRGEINAWQERIQIAVHFPQLRPDPALLRAERDRQYKSFTKLFLSWRTNPESFEHHFGRERRGYAEATVHLLSDYILASRRVNNPRDVPLDALVEKVWNPRVEIRNVGMLMRKAEDAGTAHQETFELALRFLTSEHALSAPQNEISALLMAGLARRASNGQKRPPTRGMWNDMQAISGFLPYCDAMLIDDGCARLLAEGPLKTRLACYSARVFSKQTLESFIDYLTDLEEKAGPAWLDSVIQVYGPDWLHPFDAILRRYRDNEL